MTQVSPIVLQEGSSSESVSTFPEPDLSVSSTDALKARSDHSAGQSHHELVLPAVAFSGVQLAWSVLIGHATAHLRKLGLPDSEIGFAWLAGPVSGALVQPVVGSLSDRCTSRFGRRRPFMLFGACQTLVGMLLFGFAGDIAAQLSAPPILIGVLAFWIVDAGINILQIPTRALLSDVAGKQRVMTGSAMFAMASGVGKMAGYAIGAFAPSSQTVFATAGAVVLLETLVACGVGETRPVESGEREGLWRSISGAFRRAVAALRNPPEGVRGVFAVQWLTYLAMMLSFVYGADWVGRDVFNGDADAASGSAARQRFEDGVRFANAALLGMAGLSTVLAAGLPWVVRAAGVRCTWAGSLGVMGVGLLCAPVCETRTGVVWVFLAMGGATAAAFSVPWAVVSARLDGAWGEERALCLALFNLAQATPGVVASVLGGAVVRAGRGRLGAVMFVAGVFAGGAAGAAATVPLGDAVGAGLARRAARATGDTCGNGFGNGCAAEAARAPGPVDV